MENHCYRSHVCKFSRIILTCGKDIHSPKISDEFDYRGSALLNMRIMDHLMSRPLLAFLDSFFKLPLPWASVHWLVQCRLECHWLTQCTLGYHWATQRILAGCTGTALEKLSWNSPTLECHWRNLVESTPHWDATGETLTFAAYTGTPLEGLWQPTHARTHSEACRVASMPVWNYKMAGHQ